MLLSADTKGQKAWRANLLLDLHVFEPFNRDVIFSNAIASSQPKATGEDDLVGKLIIQLSRSEIWQDFLQRPMSRHFGHDASLLLGA
jgi:hypothetical protein